MLTEIVINLFAAALLLLFGYFGGQFRNFTAVSG
jgi:hypothetical protein